MRKETSFRELLSEHCGVIADKVLAGMEANRYKVGSGKIPVPTTHILYRWWFPETFVNEVLIPYTKDYPGLKRLLGEVEKQQIDGKTYYALYFGKSVNGYHRFRQHTSGNIHTSTLRRTLYGLLYGQFYDTNKEKKLTELLQECYYEWYAFDTADEVLVECIEAICIALGKYPLNIEGNPAICEKWSTFLMEERNIK